MQEKMMNDIRKKIIDGYDSSSSDETWYNEKFEIEEQTECEKEGMTYEPHKIRVETFELKRTTLEIIDVTFE